MMLAGELLKKAEYLLTMGLHPSEVVLGYELARDKAIEELESKSHTTHSYHPLLIATRSNRVDRQNSRNSPQPRIPHSRSSTHSRLKTIRFRRLSRQTRR